MNRYLKYADYSGFIDSGTHCLFKNPQKPEPEKQISAKIIKNFTPDLDTQKPQ